MNKKVLGILCALAIISSYNIFAQSANDKQTAKQTQKQAQKQAQETYKANADENGNIQAQMNIVVKQDDETPYYAKDQGKDAEGKENKEFRGDIKDGEDATIHYIEDCPYQMHENSLTYGKTGKEVASGSLLTESPNINWTISEDGKDDSTSDNSNAASKDCKFTSAGTYSVHNSGSRQLTEADGVKPALGGKDKKDKDDKDKPEGQEAGGSNDKFLTANGTIPVKIHDVTPPDIWVAFQENDVDADKLAEVLEQKICKSNNNGEPLTEKDDDADLFSKTSFIFIDEGKIFEYEKPEGFDEMSEEEQKEALAAIDKQAKEDAKINGMRDQEYPDKTVRVSLSGSIFNENGADLNPVNNTTIVQTIESNMENLNREANCDFVTEITGKKSAYDEAQVVNKALVDKKYAVYARRNVPLLPLVTVTDNGNKRKSAASLKEGVAGSEVALNEVSDQGEENQDQIASSFKNGFYRIYKSNEKDATDGENVEPESDGSYLFRVANYPRANYEDQPYYFFETQVQDSSENSTKVRIPIYVVNSSANFEENRK